MAAFLGSGGGPCQRAICLGAVGLSGVSRRAGQHPFCWLGSGNRQILFDSVEMFPHLGLRAEGIVAY